MGLDRHTKHPGVATAGTLLIHVSAHKHKSPLGRTAGRGGQRGYIEGTGDTARREWFASRWAAAGDDAPLRVAFSGGEPPYVALTVGCWRCRPTLEPTAASA